MATEEVFTLFLASPGDVSAERALVRQIVEEGNQSLGKIGGLRVQVVGWDTDARPSWGADAQKILNGQIGDMSRHALFVGLFWNRLGTKTPRARSGTIEEFQRAAQQPKSKRPEIMLYFNQAPANLSTKVEIAQKDKLIAFKDGIRTGGVYWDYKGKADFARQFRKHYGLWLSEIVKGKVGRVVKLPRFDSPAEAAAFLEARKKEKAAVATRRTRAAKTPVPQLKLHAILLDGDLFFAEKVTETGARWTLILRPQEADDRKIRALVAPNRRGVSFPLAYQLQSGQAQINKDGERSGDEKGDFGIIELHFTSRAGGGMHSVNYAGVSADEIAQKKAEWLLLAQKPTFPAPKNVWETPDRWLEQQIVGRGADSQPILPTLWRQLEGNRAQFGAMAPLVALSRLMEAGVCEHVEELKIGLVRNSKITVSFRGTRTSVVKREAQVIKVSGVCLLVPD